MTTVVPCLVFADNAEEAITFYVSLIPNSRVEIIQRSEADGPIAKGKVMHAEFVLDGQRYKAFDGGPTFRFSEAFSLMATCDTQEELDRIWAKLASGGQEVQCGWVTDRFGVSWQVIPASLGRMLGDPVSGGKVMDAMLKMVKLDIKTLEAAYGRSA